MKADTKAMLAILVAVIAVLALGGAIIVLSEHPTVLPTTLPIPAGTVIRQAEYNATFTVSVGIGRVVGAWYADHGGDVWIYPSNSPPSGVYEMPCVGFAHWSGTVNVSLVPGTYTIDFQFGGPAVSVSITQAIRVVYPGEPPGTNGTLTSGGC
jgi:hypothetical protein